jgi:bacterioferritin (cytochrome b1)
MPDSEEKLDETAAIERLNGALELQYRSALQYSIVAASLRGLEAQAVGSKLTRFGDEELSDCRRLIEKNVSFGGVPATTVAELRYDREANEALRWLSSVSARRSSG